jgi:hypothetical protein
MAKIGRLGPRTHDLPHLRVAGAQARCESATAPQTMGHVSITVTPTPRPSVRLNNIAAAPDLPSDCKQSYGPNLAPYGPMAGPPGRARRGRIHPSIGGSPAQITSGPDWDRTSDLPRVRWSCPRMEVACAGQTGHAPGIQTCWIRWSGSLAPSRPHAMTRRLHASWVKPSATTAACAQASCTILTYRNCMQRFVHISVHKP